VFHFNKKHLEDPTIPMWVVKFRGESFYVDHVECSVPWSTKETPDNVSTKGAIKIKHCLVIIDDSNTAKISKLTDEDRERLSKVEKKPTRVITSYGFKLKEMIAQLSIKHSMIKKVGGGCGTLWFIADIYSQRQHTMLMLALSDTDIRDLKENEEYYKIYQHAINDTADYIDEDLIDWDNLYEN